MRTPDYNATAAFVEGDERVYTLPAFEFEAGGRLDNLKLGYVTHGTLNAARDNAILLAPGTANTRHSADGYIGSGNALDPARDFIIAIEAIGSGTSSQPADGLRGAFPRYNIRDLVHAQHALVTQELGIAQLKAVVGASMGAFQALEWAINYPQLVARAVLLVPAARAGNIFRNIVHTASDAVRLDPLWQDGNYSAQPLAGLRAAGRIYYPWTVTDAYLEQLPPAELARDIADTVERAAAWDAWNFIRRYETSASHDVALPYGGDIAKALGRVQARTLVLPSSTDRLLGVESAREIARLIKGAEYVEVPSERGHLGWRAVAGSPETRVIVDEVRKRLGF
jgi:homoserine O-acetyltransferase